MTWAFALSTSCDICSENCFVAASLPKKIPATPTAIVMIGASENSVSKLTAAECLKTSPSFHSLAAAIRVLAIWHCGRKSSYCNKAVDCTLAANPGRRGLAGTLPRRLLWRPSGCACRLNQRSHRHQPTNRWIAINHAAGTFPAADHAFQQTAFVIFLTPS